VGGREAAQYYDDDGDYLEMKDPVLLFPSTASGIEIRIGGI
jgi:hypothetical protein